MTQHRDELAPFDGKRNAVKHLVFNGRLFRLVNVGEHDVCCVKK